MLPDAAAFTVSLRDHFSSFALLLPWLMGWGYCRLDRPDGNGSASERSLARWAFVAFRSCFSAGIGEKTPPVKFSAWTSSKSVQDVTAAVNVEFHRDFDRSASSGLKPPLQESFGGQFV